MMRITLEYRDGRWVAAAEPETGRTETDTAFAGHTPLDAMTALAKGLANDMEARDNLARNFGGGIDGL
jgi:hypothetical protein